MSSTDNKNALIIFSRNPVLGKVKSRIARSCGTKKTLEIYSKLIVENEKLLAGLTEIDTLVFFDKYIENQIYRNNKFKLIQKGSDLGECMYKAFVYCKQKGYKNIIIIGNDCPYIKADMIHNAFKKLDENSYIIGPCVDGGYYLLGMTIINESLFKNKKWGTNTVLIDTINDIKATNESYFLLEELKDIDYYDDWIEYENQLNI